MAVRLVRKVDPSLEWLRPDMTSDHRQEGNLISIMSINSMPHDGATGKQMKLNFERQIISTLSFFFNGYIVHAIDSSVPVSFNSSPPSAADIRRWTGSALVQVMACRLFGAKPLHDPMLTYCWLDPLVQTSVKFESKYKTFHSRKCVWKGRLRNGGHFVQGGMS